MIITSVVLSCCPRTTLFSDSLVTFKKKLRLLHNRIKHKGLLEGREETNTLLLSPRSFSRQMTSSLFRPMWELLIKAWLHWTINQQGTWKSTAVHYSNRHRNRKGKRNTLKRHWLEDNMEPPFLLRWPEKDSDIVKVSL